jgi:hypothetical protein
MCCFSGNVKSVSNTRIYARSEADGRQSVVYGMHLESSNDVAMVLPIPVLPGSGEAAVHFIDLHDCPDFFDIVKSAWPEGSFTLLSISEANDAPVTASLPLKVEEVGAFEASYVPSLADFARLDERFRLPSAVWDKLPQYRQFGFVVFKFKAGKLDVHPMAFSFPRADIRSLFFPTMHIHDGIVHEREHFDHELFSQFDPASAPIPDNWIESDQIAKQLDLFKTLHDLAHPDQHFHMLMLHGMRTNKDVTVAV